MGIYTERIKENLEQCNVLVETCLRAMNKRAVRPDELYQQLQKVQSIVDITRQLVDNDKG